MVVCLHRFNPPLHENQTFRTEKQQEHVKVIQPVPPISKQDSRIQVQGY